MSRRFSNCCCKSSPHPYGHKGAYCLLKIMKPNKSRSQFSFQTKTKGSGARCLWFITAVQCRARTDSSSASRVFILSCPDSDRKGFSRVEKKKRVGRGRNSKEVSGYWMIFTVCCTPLAAGLPLHSWTHLLCMCMDLFQNQVPQHFQEAITNNPCMQKKNKILCQILVEDTTELIIHISIFHYSLSKVILHISDAFVSPIYIQSMVSYGLLGQHATVTLYEYDGI